jgi:hypothetical protein
MLIIPRVTLLTLHRKHQIGSLSGESLILYFSFQKKKVFCSTVDFTQYIDNFEDFPFIEH